MKKILIGVDDSKYAENATAYGFNLAHALQAEVGLVHIVEPYAPVGTVDNNIGMPTMEAPVDYVAADLIKVQQEQSDNIITRTIKQYGDGLQVTTFTNFGSTAEGIVECAINFGADMIVIGTHSRTGFDRLLMGSVAESVVRHSNVPVLVVPLPHTEDKAE